MKTTIRTIALMTICFLSLQNVEAGNGKEIRKADVKKSADVKNEEAHWLKGATPHNFVLPVNPMQKPVKAPLV